MAVAAGVEVRIRTARDALGLNQGELAPRMDTRRQTISDYERGAERVPLGYLSLLAGCFADYHRVLGWLEEGGDVPALQPWSAPGARSPDRWSPGAGHAEQALEGLWRQITKEMAEYERRGEAAASAQLALWLARLGATSGGGAKGEIPLAAAEQLHGGATAALAATTPPQRQDQQRKPGG